MFCIKQTYQQPRPKRSGLLHFPLPHTSPPLPGAAPSQTSRPLDGRAFEQADSRKGGGASMADPGYRHADGHPQRRKMWADTLHSAGSIQCGCKGACQEHTGQCPVIINDGDAWDLGHGVSLHEGGTGEDSVPECVRCNRVAGQLLGQASFRFSRNWWG